MVSIQVDNAMVFTNLTMLSIKVDRGAQNNVATTPAHTLSPSRQSEMKDQIVLKTMLRDCMPTPSWRHKTTTMSQQLLHTRCRRRNKAKSKLKSC